MNSGKENDNPEEKDDLLENNVNVDEKGGGDCVQENWKNKTANELLLNLLDPASAEHLKVKLADLGNACWTFKTRCPIFVVKTRHSGEIIIDHF